MNWKPDDQIISILGVKSNNSVEVFIQFHTLNRILPLIGTAKILIP